MKQNKIYLTIIACLILIAVPAVRSLAAKKHKVTCKSVIFSDSTKVKRLYGKGVHDRVLPASTAKGGTSTSPFPTPKAAGLPAIRVGFTTT